MTQLITIDSFIWQQSILALHCIHPESN